MTVPALKIDERSETLVVVDIVDRREARWDSEGGDLRIGGGGGIRRRGLGIGEGP